MHAAPKASPTPLRKQNTRTRTTPPHISHSHHIAAPTAPSKVHPKRTNALANAPRVACACAMMCRKEFGDRSRKWWNEKFLAGRFTEFWELV